MRREQVHFSSLLMTVLQRFTFGRFGTQRKSRDVCYESTYGGESDMPNIPADFR